MKRKLALLLAFTLALSTFFTGCSKDKEEDGNKDETQYVEVSSNIDYSIGDVVNVSDLVALNPEAGEIANVICTDAEGNMNTVLNTDSEGSYLVTIVIQTTDGKEYSAEYMYNVTSGLLSNGCTKEINDRLSADDITVKTINIKNSTYLTLALPQGYSYGTAIKSSFTLNGVTGTSVGSIIDNEYNDITITHADSTGKAYIEACGTMYDMVTGMLLLAAGIDGIMEPEGDNTELEKQMTDVIDSFSKELFKLESEDAGFCLYNIDGTEYPVEKHSYVLNLSLLKKGEAAYPIMYYYTVDLPNGECLVLTTKLGVDKCIVKGVDVSGLSINENGSATIGDVTITAQEMLDAGATVNEEGLVGFHNKSSENTIKLNEDVTLPQITLDDLSSVQSLTTYLQNSFEHAGEGIIVSSIATETKSQTEAISSNIYIGEYIDLELGVNQELPEEIETETESEESQQTPTTPEEPKDDESSIGNTAPTYAQRYPDIFKWPKNDTKYRRWKYILGSTDFTGSIIKPDGTILNGDNDEVDVRDESDNDPGDGGNPNKPSSTSEVYTLSSNYANYEVSDKNLPEVEFITSDSTSNRLVLKYKGELYYIELVKASQVNSYKTNCLYTTTTFKDGQYNVVDANSKTSELGKINEFNVKYFDTSSNEWERPYMSVLITDSDYLVCYANNLVKVGDSILTSLLEKMVTKN